MIGDQGHKARPLPQPDDDITAAFWEHCAKGELRFQRCSSCGTWRHLPRPRCASCGSREWSWQPSSGRGKIWSWTITHQPLLRNFPEQVPFASIVVELEEGVRMVSGLRGLAPSELRLDLPVEVVFEDVADGVQMPFFRPRKADA
jgi:uncharacterized OB-fold protein